ncbi:hypothetical protein L3X38_005435 [Prunus dulcis]|uniref:Uncharacterized protein n=1 Tax=Prunus dulcis TaxID=3755 RepID=A0AAD4ZR05_PRUDU|nr:hypothetical protein L3X38_005435 [Prunus dulcis]
MLPLSTLRTNLIIEQQNIFPFQAAPPDTHPPPSNTTPVIPTPFHDSISTQLPDDPHDTAAHLFDDPCPTLPTPTSTSPLPSPPNVLHNSQPYSLPVQPLHRLSTPQDSILSSQRFFM